MSKCVWIVLSGSRENHGLSKRKKRSQLRKSSRKKIPQSVMMALQSHQLPLPPRINLSRWKNQCHHIKLEMEPPTCPKSAQRVFMMLRLLWTPFLRLIHQTSKATLTYLGTRSSYSFRLSHLMNSEESLPNLMLPWDRLVLMKKRASLMSEFLLVRGFCLKITSHSLFSMPSVVCHLLFVIAFIRRFCMPI